MLRISDYNVINFNGAQSLISYDKTDDVIVDVASPANCSSCSENGGLALKETENQLAKLIKNKTKFDHNLSEINDAWVICS